MHPLFLLRLRLQTRAGLRKQGLSFAATNDLMSGVENWEDTVRYAAARSRVPVPDFTADTSAGDGTLFEKIVAAIEKFLASDLGKALVQALIALLIGA